MNKGISNATGDYLLFLNSDDWLPEKTIEIVFEEIRNNLNNDIYYGNSSYYKNNNKIFTQKSDIKNIFKKTQCLINHVLFKNNIYRK